MVCVLRYFPESNQRAKSLRTARFQIISFFNFLHNSIDYLSLLDLYLKLLPNPTLQPSASRRIGRFNLIRQVRKLVREQCALCIYQ